MNLKPTNLQRYILMLARKSTNSTLTVCIHLKDRQEVSEFIKKFYPNWTISSVFNYKEI